VDTKTETVSLRRAAQMLDISERHARRLVDAGTIQVEERRGAVTGTRYAVAVTAIEQLTAERNERRGR
jgi:hypothetical protein